MTEEKKTPKGEESLEFKVEVDPERDPLAVYEGEHEPVRVEIAPYTQEGEPQNINTAPQKLQMVLAASKKFYQRGIVQFIVNGRRPLNINIDLLASLFAHVYEVRNPYEKYNPLLDRVEVFAFVKVLKPLKLDKKTGKIQKEEVEVQEICLDEKNVPALKRKYPECEVRKAVMSVEEFINTKNDEKKQ